MAPFGTKTMAAVISKQSETMSEKNPEKRGGGLGRERNEKVKKKRKKEGGGGGGARQGRKETSFSVEARQQSFTHRKIQIEISDL